MFGAISLALALLLLLFWPSSSYLTNLPQRKLNLLWKYTNKLFSIWNGINRQYSTEDTPYSGHLTHNGQPPFYVPPMSTMLHFPTPDSPTPLTMYLWDSALSVYALCVCVRATPHNSFAYFIGCHLIICILQNFWPRPRPAKPHAPNIFTLPIFYCPHSSSTYILEINCKL